MTYWISQPENQLFLFGLLLLFAGGVLLILMALPRHEEPVEVYQETLEPVAYAPTTHSEFKYTVMDEWYPFAQNYADACDAVADAITDVIQAVEPLTAELEVIDYSTPLYYQIRRPKPLELESFTRGWSREQVNRAIEAGRPQ